MRPRNLVLSAILILASAMAIVSCAPARGAGESGSRNPPRAAREAGMPLPGSRSGPARIWTDQPSLVIAADLFNASQTGFRVELEYREDLSNAIASASILPSLVVGRFIRNRETRTRFQPLEQLFGELALPRSSFESGMLDLGAFGGRQLFLPLAYNLPAIVYAPGSFQPGDDLTIDLNEMKRASLRFDKKGDGKTPPRMGFSPLWNTEFFLRMARSRAVRFRESAIPGRGVPEWEAASLEVLIRSIRSWNRNPKAPGTAERDFQFKYLFTPEYRYLTEGRALFASMDSARFLTLPAHQRKALAFRWFSDGLKIPVGEDMVFAAMPKDGGGKAAAEAFLSWLLQSENQKTCLAEAQAMGALDLSFGFLGGIPTISKVAREYLPRIYPELASRLPSADSLAFAPVLPPAWRELAGSVILPWLDAKARSKLTSDENSAELTARIEDYLKNSKVDREE